MAKQVERADKTLCSSCDTKLTKENTYKNKFGYNGLDSKCKSCKIAYATNWNKVSPKRRAIARKNNHLESSRSRKAAHCSQRRARMRETELTPLEYEWLLFYYDEARRMTDVTGIQYDVDHVKPISRGGEHAPWNMQLLTGYENRVKGAKWHSEAA